MKKIILFSFFLFSVLISNAIVQTIYTEDFDNGGSMPNGWTVDPASSEWLIDDGTGTGLPSPGSGTYQLVGSNGNVNTEIIVYDNGLSTASYKDIQITWDAYKDAGFPGPITFEWSTDGSTWNAQAFTDVGTGSWATITTFTLAAGANNVANLRFRFTYTSDGSGWLYLIDDFKVEGTPYIYYSKSTGNLEDVNSWSITSDGLGASPPNFTENGTTYIIINNATPTIGGNWVVSGTGSQVSVGDGAFTTNFTIPATFTTSATFNINNNGTLSNAHLTFNPTLGTLATGSTVNYSGVGTQTLTNTTYSNLTISGTGAKVHTGTNITVNGVFTITAPATLTMNTSGIRSLILAGTISGTGTLTGSGGSRLFVNGTGSFGTLYFTAGSQTLHTLNINRTASGTVTLGTNLSVTNTFSNNNGEIILNGNTLTIATSTMSQTSGSFTGSSTSNLTFSGAGATTFTISFTQTSSSTRSLNNLTISRTSTGGIRLNNPLEIIGDVTLSGGAHTLTTNGNLTLKCSSAACARIAPITGSQSISGDVTVERFSPGNYTGWGLLGSPITSALTMSAWDDDIALSCSNCPDGYPGGFTSVYTYFEPDLGAYNSAGSYIAIPNYATAITNGKGYYVYYGTGYTITTDITLDVTGSVRTGTVDLAPTYNSSGVPNNDGWNLLANPYPSPISWNSLSTGAGTPGNIDDTWYSYNADLNGHTGGYANYNWNTGISTPAVGAGGVDDDIPLGQGFFVHLTGATTLVAAETHKVGGNPTFRKTGTTNPSTLATQYFRLQLTGPSSYKDETVLSFYPGATDTFDTDYDAWKLFGSGTNSPYIAFLTNGDMYSVNNIPPLTQNISLPVYLKIVTGGTYTISEDDIANIPGACITLFDSIASISTDLRTSSYTFTISPGQYSNRFKLNITVAPTFSFNSSSNNPSCTGVNDGFIVAAPSNTGPWDYTWRDSTTYGIIQQHLNISTPDTLFNIGSGNYIVEINSTGMCDFATQTFNVTSAAPSLVTLAVNNVFSPLCDSSFDGHLVAMPSGSGPWNYYWKDSISGLNVQTHLNISTPDTLFNLNSGTYIVEARSIGGCDSAVHIFNITAPAPVWASFTASDDTLYTSLGANVNFTNTSSNATNYSWNFGDASGATTASPTHAYSAAGTYTVTLKAYNTTCNDSSETTFVVEVLTSPAGVEANSNTINDDIFIGQNQQGTYVKFGTYNQSNALISVTNLLGQKITTDIRTKINGQTVYLNLTGINNKILFITVTSDNNQVTKKIYNH